MYYFRNILFILFILIQSADSLAETIKSEDSSITSGGSFHMIPPSSITLYLLEFKEDGRVFYKGHKIGTNKELFQALKNVLLNYDRCHKSTP